MPPVRLLAALLICCVLAVAGCSAATGAPASKPGASGGAQNQAARPSFPADSYMARIQQRGQLTAGVKYDTPPFGSLNPINNQVEGFDADLARELARSLFGDPTKVQFVEAISRNRIPFLQEDKVDIILSTMTITDERKQEIDFSDVYYIAGQSLLVKKGSPITSVDGLAGRTVASGQGTTSEKNIRERAPNANLVLFPSWADVHNAVRDGRADAASTDDVILMGMMLKDPDVQMVGGLFTEEPYGAGIKKGRPEFVAFVNEVFAKLKADGTWTALYQQHIAPLSGFVAEPPK